MGILVISDDLTGANDTGVKFYQHHVPTRVFLKTIEKALSRVGASIINTDTRDLSGQDAYAYLKDTFKSIIWDSFDLVYKKIDSTMRGNIGSELVALLEQTPHECALIIPAYPLTGRITVGGYHLVQNQLLEDTEFTNGLKSLKGSSYLPHMIEQQTKQRVHHIDINAIRTMNILEVIEQKRKEGIKFFVLDSTSDDDLDHVVNSLREYLQRFLWVGSAGLAAALARKMGNTNCLIDQNNIPNDKSNNSESILILSGSMSAQTSNQINYLKGKHVPILEIDPSYFFYPEQRKEKIKEWLAAGSSAIESGNHLVVSLLNNKQIDAQLLTVMENEKLTKVELSNEIAYQFGRLGAEMTKLQPLKGLILTGGAIAYQTCQHLNVEMLQISGQVEEGIPLCVVTNGPFSDLKVVTKAGGFGQPSSLFNAIETISKSI